MFRSPPRHPGIIGVIRYEAVREIDWRVGASPESTAAFAAAVSDSRYTTPWSSDSEPRPRR